MTMGLMPVCFSNSSATVRPVGLAPMMSAVFLFIWLFLIPVSNPNSVTKIRLNQSARLWFFH